jgi:hypothetical protein
MDALPARGDRYVSAFLSSAEKTDPRGLEGSDAVTKGERERLRRRTGDE